MPSYDPAWFPGWSVEPGKPGHWAALKDFLDEVWDHFWGVLAQKVCVARVNRFHAVGSLPGNYNWNAPDGRFFLYSTRVSDYEVRGIKQGEKMLPFLSRYQYKVSRWEMVLSGEGFNDCWIRVDGPVNVKGHVPCYCIHGSCYLEQ